MLKFWKTINSKNCEDKPNPFLYLDVEYILTAASKKACNKL